jgi:hypothetical protein
LHFLEKGEGWFETWFFDFLRFDDGFFHVLWVSKVDHFGVFVFDCGTDVALLGGFVGVDKSTDSTFPSLVEF